MHRRSPGLRLDSVIAGVCLFASLATAQDNLAHIQRPGFEIDIPSDFVLSEHPAASMALEVSAPPAVDRRGLRWEMLIRVQSSPGANRNRVPVEQVSEQLAQRIRTHCGANLIAGPAAIAGDIRGADSALLLIYRTREQGMRWWRFDMYVHAGPDIWFVSAFLGARAGSEVLDKDHPANQLLRKALLSFKVIREAATQQTTQPATTPSTHPALPAASP